MSKYYVWLDAGHSKATAGKRNTVANPAFYEYEFNNDVALKLKKRLEEHGMTVFLTNSTPEGADIALTTRANTANNKWKELGSPANAIFVSIHGNASSGPWAQARGVEVYHASNASQNSKDLALLLTNQIYEDIKKIDNGFKNRGRKQSDFTVIYKAQMKSVLIEHAFYDNKEDLNLLQKHREVFVEADCKAICKYFGITYKAKGTQNPEEKKEVEPVKNYCILYGNDIDKVGAEIVGWAIPNSTVLHVDKYNGGYWGVITVGGPAKQKIDANFKINYTAIVGADRYETTQKALDYANSKKAPIVEQPKEEPKQELAKLQDDAVIMSKPTATLEQIQKWAAGQNDLFKSWIPIAYEVGLEYGVDPVVIVAQEAVETAYGKFGGVLDESFCNVCGLKTPQGGGNYDPNAHTRFASWKEGITAQVQHLALYADPNHKCVEKVVDPRHFDYIKGTASTCNALSSKWASGNTYGEKLNKLCKQIVNTK